MYQNVKHIIVLPPHYHHLWVSLRMKIDTTLDKLQEMVMDSHLQAAKKWCDDMAASMSELMLKILLKNDVNRQVRNSKFYPPQPEPSPEVVEATTASLEENLSQSRSTEDSELRDELEAQKQKQQGLEA